MNVRRPGNVPFALAAGILLALLASVVSCGLVVSFGKYDTSPGQVVGGTATGLEGRTVTLLLNQAYEVTVGDGAFAFRERLVAGDTYLVEVKKNPSGRMCTVLGDRGSVVGDVSDIRVMCGTPSSNANLASLSLSAGPAVPAFHADTTKYDVTVSALFALTTTVTAMPEDPEATIVIGGVAAPLGTASVPIVPIVPNSTSVAIIVTAADRITTKTYTVAVHARPSDYLKASNTMPGAQFGTSVALSGDTLAVGAWMESSVAPQSGAVYIFTRTATDAGSVWSQQAYLKASNPHAQDAFGDSISLAGDTLVVGAQAESGGATGVNGDQSNQGLMQSGAAYVFVRTGTGANAVWSQQAYLKASNAETQNHFGRAVALSGDTIAVGATAESSIATGINGSQDQAVSGAYGSGAAYVFTRTNGAWSQAAYLKASNTRATAAFGTTLALDGDTLAVAATGESNGKGGINGSQKDTSAPNAGAVYVFARTGAAWSQQAYVKASNPGWLARFGAAIALSGETMAVGATGESSLARGIDGDQSLTFDTDACAHGDKSVCATQAGAVYVFKRSRVGGVPLWSQEAYVKASNTRAEQFFGEGVALFGDMLAVGAPFEDSRATGLNGSDQESATSAAGAAYVFRRNGAKWSQQAYVKASNTRSGSNFGWSVALSVDALVVGASSESSGAGGAGSSPESGAAYLFR